MDVRVGTVKKAERCRTDAFEVCCWRRLLRVPWTARRFNQSNSLKEIRDQSWARVETGMSGNFLRCSKGVEDPSEVPEYRCD